MATFKYSEIKDIMRCTPEELKGKQVYDVFKGDYLNIGGFYPSGCNWSYWVVVVNYNGMLRKLVTVFDTIK